MSGETNETGKEMPLKEKKQKKELEKEAVKKEELEEILLEKDGRISELEVLVEEKSELAEKYLKNWQRTQADYENLLKRTHKEQGNLLIKVKERFILSLIEIFEDFERIVEASSDQKNFETVVTGMRIVLDKFWGFLKSEGISRIETVGATYDLLRHEVVSRVFTSEIPENTIVEEVNKGYMLYSKVLKPAQVVVGVSPNQKSSNEEGDE